MTSLHGFAYGEYLEGLPPRSLGYRLLTPGEREPWCVEVETLARLLQAAPYPEHWPPAELFCSVLLSDGRRLVAVARYGLADHTASQRRGGLEFFGVIGPGSLGVPSAQAIDRWLRQRRAGTEDLRQFHGPYSLEEILTAVPPVASPAQTISVLPIRIWQEGVLLFAATAPTDPDQRLGLLEQGHTGIWQWLPFVGADFPFAGYAQRGPLIAWTRHLSGVAVKLDQPPLPASPSNRPMILIGGIIAIVGLLAANLWTTLTLPGRVASREPAAMALPESQSGPRDDSAERLARGLRRLIAHGSGAAIGDPAQVAATYERLAAADSDLRVQHREGKEVVVLVQALSRHSVGAIPDQIRRALQGKGYDPELINLICRRVQEGLDQK